MIRNAATLVLAACLAGTVSSPTFLPAQELPTLEPIDEIGCATCDGPEAFGSIGELAVLPGGRVVVADRDEPLLRVFGADGGIAATFGRRGDGPGELKVVAGVVGLADGRIVVADMRRPGLQVYDADGEPLDSQRLDAMVMDLQAAPDGSWLAVQTAHWQTMSAGVEAFDPVSFEKTATPLPDTRGTLADEGGEPVAPGQLSMAPGPDGRLAVGAGHEYRIHILDREGTLLGTIIRSIPRAPRAAEEMERLRDRRAAAWRRMGRSNPEGAADRPDIDPFHPHFAGRGALTYDGDGRLWVRTPRGGLDQTVFDVFDATGAFLGEVVADVPLRMHAIAGDRLAGVTEDPDLGIQRIVRWRIR